MTDKETEALKECCNKKNWGNANKGANAGGGAVYCLGLIGALFYYLGHANSFATVVMGILKSIVWPAMMVYHLFGFLRM